jgi:hypothetical protein
MTYPIALQKNCSFKKYDSYTDIIGNNYGMNWNGMRREGEGN